MQSILKIIGVVLFIFLIIWLWKYLFSPKLNEKLNQSSNKKLNQKFYECKNIYPELYGINDKQILNEIYKNINNDSWINWPEKDLYQGKEIDGTWKIIPFYGFGTWCAYCKIFPHLTNFLKSLPNLKIALLSKLSPNTTLVPHCGWGKHSNNVLRCHYGLKLPNNKSLSYVGVKENENDVYEIQNHVQNDWLVFDDSKLHYASNNSKYEDRIVLIVDLVRPEYIERGKSTIEESSELLNIIDEMKRLES